MGLFDSIAGFAGQMFTNRTNVKLAREGQAFEQSMWEQSNEYNSPAAQMQRLKDAGLNPNLVYGSGSVAGNTSQASQPHAIVPNVQNPLSSTSIGDVLGILTAFAQYRQINAKTENIKLDSILKDYQQPILVEKLGVTQHQNELLGISSEVAFRTWKERVQSLKNEYAKSGVLLSTAEIENSLKKYDEEMQSQLKQYNLTNADSIWARLLVNVAKKLGVNF